MLQTICNPCFLIICISMKIVKNPCMQEFQQKIALKQTYILIGFPWTSWSSLLLLWLLRIICLIWKLKIWPDCIFWSFQIQLHRIIHVLLFLKSRQRILFMYFSFTFMYKTVLPVWDILCANVLSCKNAGRENMTDDIQAQDAKVTL